MDDRREQIERALQRLIARQRARDFQSIAFHVLKNNFPALQLPEWNRDGGEDAFTLPAADGRKVSLACSLSATKQKVKEDCQRIKERNIRPDLIIFVTAGYVERVKIDEWKKEIQNEFGHDLEVITGNGIVAALERPENHWLCRAYLELDLPDAPGTAALIPVVRTAAAQRLEGWKSAYRYADDKQIELSIRVQSPPDGSESRRMRIAEVCEQLRGGRHVILRGVAGAGKTFTLLQVAERLLTDESGPIPIFVSLAEWTQSGDELTTLIAAELQTSIDNLAILDRSGRLAFLLNGWNEIPEARIEQAAHALRRVARLFPHASIVVSTREKESAPPLPRAEDFHLEPLSPEQRQHMIVHTGGKNAHTILRAIEGNPLLEEVTRTPLFLSVAVNIAARGGEIPRSRYGLLNTFVEQAEAEHRHALNSVCKGQHRRYLEHLAAEMTNGGGASLTLDQALAVVGRCTNTLHDAGLIGTKLDAWPVLETLLNHHLLMRGQTGS